MNGTKLSSNYFIITNISAFVILCFMCSTGCSLILYQVGALIDAPKPEHEDIQGDDIEKIPKESEVSVMMNDGSLPKGKYIGVSKERSDEGRMTENPPTYLRLMTTDGLKSIDLNNIIFVRKKNDLDTKWTLLTIGIIVDAVVTVVLVGYALAIRGAAP